MQYKRAYYYGNQAGGGGYFPQDEKLGIHKRRTPGCQCFLSSFTGREAYQKGLDRFHEIFRLDGKTTYPSLWRDAKIGAVSSIGWDEKHQEAFCEASSYVGGIEYADEFFKRLTVEVQRRTDDLKTTQVVFLADEALESHALRRESPEVPPRAASAA